MEGRIPAAAPKGVPRAASMRTDHQIQRSSAPPCSGEALRRGVLTKGNNSSKPPNTEFFPGKISVRVFSPVLLSENGSMDREDREVEQVNDDGRKTDEDGKSSDKGNRSFPVV
jgi:hypothetical protein